MVGGAMWCGLHDLEAQDWPQWRGAGADGKVSGFSPPRSWTNGLRLKWRVTVGLGDATPALVGDRLFVFVRQGEQEVVLALDPEDGKPIWRQQYAAPAVTGPAAQYQGPRSSPAVGGGKVVTLGVGGTIHCWDAALGTLLWRQNDFTNPVPMFFTAMSPLISDGRCLAHLGGAGQGTFVALDLFTGRPKWTWAGDGPAYASLAPLTVGEVKQIVVQTEKHLLGLALADGRLLWRVPTPPQSGYWNSASPVVAGNTVIYTGQGTGTRALEITRQGEAWVPKELWHNPQLGTVYNTPVLKDGQIFALSDRGRLFCLAAQSGRTAWISTNRFSQFGSILDAGSVLLALPEKSGLVAFRPSADRYEELGRLKPSESPIYAHPVVAGKKVFIKDRETVARWTYE